MHIPPIDHIRTMHFEVTEKVEFFLQPRAINTIRVDFWVQSNSDHTAHRRSKAKPRGYDGAVIIWHFGDEEPKAPEDYRYHAMASRRPHNIIAHDSDRAKKCWVRLAWQNHRGIRGEFAQAQYAIVP